MIIKLKIDVTKIDKERLFIGKNGAKYLDLTLLENKNGTDQYGNDFMVVQDITKAERESGQRGAILGNGKFIGSGGQKSARPPEAEPVTGKKIDEDDVPF